MPEDYKEDLKKLLRELFQFDNVDLDFGIYRIMNHKRKEIEKFIEKELIEAVDAAFEKYSVAGRTEIEKELLELKKRIEENIDKDAFEATTGEIKKEYRKTQLADQYYKKKEELAGVDAAEQHKAEIFSHIYQFFSRYYHEGDFLSLRRYSKENKYAIPYNGEEVLLHWANNDQYYIKTGEYFQNYSFKAGDFKVSFRVSNAEVDQNNVKSDKRYFIFKSVDGAINFDPEKKELTIYFEYRGLTGDEEERYGKQNIQEKIAEFITAEILAGIKDGGLKGSLGKSKEGKTLLEKHLNKYTKKNTTDYFIHKDLKGFLERELDFYIKNEIFNLDDLGGGKEASVEKYITRVKVIKEISKKIIEFLSQIEEFQKKLWEKKKFVIKTEYCMTLDKVPEEFYYEIGKNEVQVAEWKRLFDLDEITKGAFDRTKGKKILEADFLKSHRYLVLDTKFFGREFKDRLLAIFEDLDEDVGGLIIKSENWQALNLLIERYRARVKCCYIDPPYNTGNDEFVYKDNYQHSSWLSLMYDRVRHSRSLLQQEGTYFISIDDNEVSNLRSIMDSIFGKENFLTQLIIQANKRGQTYKQISKTHEYVLLYVNSQDVELNELEKEGDKEDLNLSDEIGRFNIRELRNRNPKFGKHNRPNLFYPIYVNPNKIRDKDGFLPISLTEKKGYSVKVEPYDSNGRESCWRWGSNLLEKNIDENTVKSNVVAKEKRDGGYNIYEKYRKSTYKAKSIWDETEVITEQGTIELGKLGLSNHYDFPKPVGLLKKVVTLSSSPNDIILDFFAGSGTTAHAILILNQEDESNRKYILVEMGDYFDTVLKLRIQKEMFANEWKDSKPVSKEGVSHMFKYQYLEQYEDALNNIEFVEGGAVQKALDTMDDYFLKYMLGFETRDSLTRLNVDKFSRPFEYKLKILNRDNEMADEAVDLVETFNYLLGLHVKRIRAFNNDGTYYRVVFGSKGDENIAVIWRNSGSLDLKTEKKFIESTVLKDPKPDTVYINGDSYLENARPIEPEFKKLMGG